MFDNFDFSKLETYDKFIEYAKLLDSDYERVQFIYAYFKKCVEYNYEQMFCGYLIDILGLNDKIVLSKNYIVPESNYFYKKYLSQIDSSKQHIYITKDNCENSELLEICMIL